MRRWMGSDLQGLPPPADTPATPTLLVSDHVFLVGVGTGAPDLFRMRRYRPPQPQCRALNALGET